MRNFDERKEDAGKMDESGEMEHEIVKPLRENVAENGLDGRFG